MLIITVESWVVIELAIIGAGWDFRITKRDTTIVIIIVTDAANIVASVVAITAITANNDSSLGLRSSGKLRLTDQYHYYA